VNWVDRSRMGLILGQATISAKLGRPPIRLAAVRTSRFEPRPALLTKSGVKRVFVLASRANHTSRQTSGAKVHYKWMGRWECLPPQPLTPKLDDRTFSLAAQLNSGTEREVTLLDGTGASHRLHSFAKMGYSPCCISAWVIDCILPGNGEIKQNSSLSKTGT
jgi:hypothetical protein